MRDVVRFYVDPPAHAIVLSVDEKAQIQALDRTQPGLPMKKGRAGTMTHDYKRHGTTTLFAALDLLEGKVIGRCMQRHRHQEFIRFLNAIEAQVPARKIVHVILHIGRHLDEHDRIAIELAALEKNIAEDALRDERVKRLMTIGGVNAIVALGVLQPSATSLASRRRKNWSGQLFRASIPRCGSLLTGPACHGRISRQGRAYARAMLVDAAWSIATQPGLYEHSSTASRSGAAADCRCRDRNASWRF